MKNLLLLFFVSLLFVGCRKDTPQDVKFEVNASQLTVKAGSPVKFDIQNAAQNVTFYSGEVGNEYKYKNRNTLAGKIELQFTTNVLNGTGNHLTVWVTPAIGHTLTTDAVTAANWTEITDRAVISTGVDHTPSGKIDLSEFNEGAGKLILGFRFADVKRSAGQARVYVRAIELNKVTDDGKNYKLLDLPSGGWQAVNFLNSAAVWSVNADRLFINGGAATSESNEDWVISRAVDLVGITPDVGIILKSAAESLVPFEYTFQQPGTYTATFVASNRYLHNVKEIVKEIEIIVTD